MDFETLMPLIEPINYKEPGFFALAVLEKNRSKRGMALDEFQPVNGYCCYCNIMLIEKPRRRYCSDDCAMSAFMNANPNTPTVRAWIIINRQQGACLACGVIQDVLFERARHRLKYWPDKKITYYSLGDQTGHLINVDHVVPIHRGGAAVGLKNVQVLCVGCHIRKTKEENDR